MSFGSQREPLQNSTTLVVAGDPPSSSFTRYLQNSNGDGYVIDTSYVYGPTGVSLAEFRVTVSYLGGSLVEDFKPKAPVLIFSDAQESSYDTSFALQSGDTTANVTVSVNGRDTVAVGGTQYSAYDVREVAQFSGKVQGRATSMLKLEAANLLPLQEDMTMQTNTGPLVANMNESSTCTSTAAT